jgi:4-hydroxy-tetrahydrodipicolinate synthase
MMRMITSIRPYRPEFSFLTGWEAVLVPMLMVGADGGTHATSGVVPELTRQMYELAKAKQFEPAMALQYRLLELFDAMFYSADFPEGFRAAVELRGFAMGKGRQPLSTTQQIDRVKLQQILRCILADFGYVETPAEGCPPKRGDLEPIRVRRIADEVVNELRKKGLV